MSDKQEDFRRKLEHAINYHSMESGSDTPDFMLADFLADCLIAFDKVMAAREKWYGRVLHINAGPVELPEAPNHTAGGTGGGK